MKKIKLILIINAIPMLVMAQPKEDDLVIRLTEGWTGWLIFSTLLLAIIAIVTQAVASRKFSQKLTTSEKVNSTLRNDVEWLKKNQLTPDHLKPLEDRLKKLEVSPVKPDAPSREIVWDGPSVKKTLPAMEQTPAVQQIIPENTKPAYEVRYAKFPNLDDGFGPDMITSIQNGEQVYEIQATGDTAIFRIANDMNAQKYALAEPAFTLNKACELSNQPFKGCRIVLHSEGTLVKISGNWIVQQKAKIEFK